MKVEINETPTQENAEYPCLKVGKRTGVVVLFTDKRKGTVVFEGNKIYELGFHSEVWNEENFTSYNGSITLSND